MNSVLEALQDEIIEKSLGKMVWRIWYEGSEVSTEIACRL